MIAKHDITDGRYMKQANLKYLSQLFEDFKNKKNHQ